MQTPDITAADLRVKTLEYLVELWDKDQLPEEMKAYVMEAVPILGLLYNNKNYFKQVEVTEVPCMLEDVA